MAGERIGVTGATGGLGGRVARRLADHGVAQRLLVRDAARAPGLEHAEVATFGGYDDAEGVRRALEGIETLFLVSAAEDRDRVRCTARRWTPPSRRAWGGSSTRRSSRPRRTPRSRSGATTSTPRSTSRQAGVAHTFLRDNLYIDFIPRLCPPEGVIRGPAGDGRVAAVARDDIADVAAAC